MLKQLIKSALRSAGLEVRRITSQTVAESDAYPFEADWISGIANFVNPYTMTSPERLEVLCRAVAHIGQHAIKGDFVECGVWRGGSMMAAALTLMHYQDANRRLYLYDTFQGMTEPTDIDVEARSGKPAKELMKNPRWPVSPLEDVKRNMALTGYPSQLVHYVVGKVEDTIPSSAPDEIALLRLDTDWYHYGRAW
jgi:O-methyltransferase